MTEQQLKSYGEFVDKFELYKLKEAYYDIEKYLMFIKSINNHGIWIPYKGQKLIEIETNEPCYIMYLSVNSSLHLDCNTAYIKWDNCCYGTYNILEVFKKFAPVAQ